MVEGYQYECNQNDHKTYSFSLHTKFVDEGNEQGLSRQGGEKHLGHGKVT